MSDGKSEKTITKELSTETYLAADSFGDLLALAGADLQKAHVELGDGYAIVEKDQLLGKCMILNGANEVVGDHGAFVSVTAILQDPIRVNGELVSKVRFNDGSTGIYAQIITYLDKHDGNFKPLLVKKGIRKSEYDYEGPDGTSQPATTHYIDTSA